ncbi:hypothetical protein F53441_4556 [Fusarium austroafricanum]|uniref:Uncharacterized protein n=1 Tax=Fusarium austroafricanum TaxID=2364996 RepID=A0A8H4KK13_9HYPO|nr:hypothetical protein F53441_4556 [Fusarium austroafricanum]
MPTSPGTKAGELSSRASSLTTFRRIEGERDFDRLGSIIPDSQIIPNTLLSQPLKLFSAPKEEVSISSMSEGFCFGEKKPPRPGQYTQRPKLGQPPSTSTSHSLSNSAGVLPEHPPPSPQHAPISQIPQPAAPLDLPELGLLGSKHPSKASSDLCQEDFPGLSGHHESHNSQKTSPREAPALGNTVSASGIYVDSSVHSHDCIPPPAAMDVQPVRNKSFSSVPQGIGAVTPIQGSRRLEGKKEPSYFANDHGKLRPHTRLLLPAHRLKLGRRLEDLKLPLPHITRTDRSSRHAPPSSACGDLETPAPQTPMTTRPRDRSSCGHRPNHPPATSNSYRESGRNHDRLQSRASNISKKRSVRQKFRPRPKNEPNRKKIAMQNVAEYWNECIQIADAERHDALQEIALLEDKLHHAKKALDKSAQLISERDSVIHDNMRRYERLQEEESLAKKETQRLHSEVESLHSDLAKSQDHAAAVQEKYRKNRAKLNEAIKEQQDLFSRARNFHKETNDELQKERDRRENEAKAVELALEASQKKREELKACIEKYKAETEQDAKEKNLTISELQMKLEQQQKEHIRERDAAIELQNRLKAESSLLDMVKNIHSDLSSLKDSTEKYNNWSENQDKLTGSLSKKLDLINNHLNSHNEGRLTNEEVKSMMDHLETSITSSLMTEIHNIVSSQTKAEQSAANFQGTLQENVEKLHNGVAEQQSVQSKDQQWREETHQVLVEHLDDISARALATQKTCDETKRNLAELATGHSVWREVLQTRFGTEVAKQLQDRESRIGELEETMRHISQEWSKKLDILKATTHENNEQAKEYLQATIHEIKSTLEEKLQGERVASENDISKSEAIHATVEAHLQQVKMQLEGLSSSDPGSQLLRETLTEERQKTRLLQEQLAALEGNSGANDELCERQHQNLRAIDTLKTQLEGMSKQVPRVESLNTAFNQMVDLNQLMQTTASYLSKERHWVSEQLEVKSQVVGSHGLPLNETGTDSAYFDEQRSEESMAWIQTQGTATKLSASLSDLDTLDVHSQGERYRRKVVVASPALEASSPSPPPSVAQEQLRRREGSNPRSILRLATAQEPEPARAPVNHSQYNRPVAPKVNSTAGCTNPAMVEQIRSGLIQSKPKSPNWEFPTMEDFAKEILPSGKDDSSLGQKHSINLVDEAENATPAMKRVKSEEPQDTSEPESINRSSLFQTRHVVQKTYSRKSSN